MRHNLLHGHDCGRAAHGEDGCRTEIEYFSFATGGGGNADVCSNLKPTVPCITINILVGIGQHGLPIIGTPTFHEVTIPFFIDPTGIGCCGPMGDTASAYDRNSFGNTVACTP